jgi:hypothetical protein
MTAVTRGRACEGKQKLTERHALKIVGWRVSNGAAPGSLNAYECPFDPSHWHVGHVPGRGKRSGGRS